MASCDDVFPLFYSRMFFSGGQCGHVGRPEEHLLMLKIFLVICLHVVLVTSLGGKVPVFLHCVCMCVFI